MTNSETTTLVDQSTRTQRRLKGHPMVNTVKQSLPSEVATPVLCYGAAKIELSTDVANWLVASCGTMGAIAVLSSPGLELNEWLPKLVRSDSPTSVVSAVCKRPLTRDHVKHILYTCGEDRVYPLEGLASYNRDVLTNDDWKVMDHRWHVRQGAYARNISLRKHRSTPAKDPKVGKLTKVQLDLAPKLPSWFLLSEWSSEAKLLSSSSSIDLKPTRRTVCAGTPAMIGESSRTFIQNKTRIFLAQQLGPDALRWSLAGSVLDTFAGTIEELVRLSSVMERFS